MPEQQEQQQQQQENQPPNGAPANGGQGGNEDEYPEGLGDAGKAAIQRERDARKALQRELTELRPLAQKARELEEQGKTETQRERDARVAAEQRADQALTRLAKIDAAIEAGLDLKLADRITGDSPEEMVKDAKELAKLFAPPPPGTPGGVRGDSEEQAGNDMNTLIRRAAGRA